MSTESNPQITEFARLIRERFPSCPQSEVDAIAWHACQVGSGRVGTSDRVEDPIRAAVVAHIRHQHTDYEDQLFFRRNRQSARENIRDLINEKLRDWQRDPGEPDFG